jgi:hypothetical protein
LQIFIIARGQSTHRAVDTKHLPRYLGAFAWRFNRRTGDRNRAALTLTAGDAHYLRGPGRKTAPTVKIR